MSFNALNLANQKIEILEEHFLKRKLRVTESACDTKQTIDNRLIKMFCSNDYLGLANHPLLIEALQEGARLYGVGSGASHLISGHSIAHEELEEKLASFQQSHIPEIGALFFSTGYQANVGVITSLSKLGVNGNQKTTTIYSAALNHASIIDGVRLASTQSGARVEIFDHQNLRELKDKIENDDSILKIIITDGVFSMDGDLAPLDELLALAEQYDALLMVDDAHGFGVLGEHGHGILEHFNLNSARLIYIGTLGKAAGVSGAFVCCKKILKDWIFQNARSYIYTTATPPAIAHTITQSLNLIDSPQGLIRRNHLKKLVNIWHEEYQPRNWSKIPSSTPIQPLIIGSNEVAIKVAQLLDHAGFWIAAIRPPTVPVNMARLRVTFSANHSEDDLRELCLTLQKIETLV